VCGAKGTGLSVRRDLASEEKPEECLRQRLLPALRAPPAGGPPRERCAPCGAAGLAGREEAHAAARGGRRTGAAGAAGRWEGGRAHRGLRELGLALGDGEAAEADALHERRGGAGSALRFTGRGDCTGMPSLGMRGREILSGGDQGTSTGSSSEVSYTMDLTERMPPYACSTVQVPRILSP
jgi:hypothetical protein